MKKRGRKKVNSLKKNQRGLSTIVVTLIIVLVSLVAVGVVWVVIKNVINSGSNDITLGKFTINLKIEDAYESSGNITVKVKRNVGEGDLVKIKFVLSDDENSEIITRDTDLTELKTKTFTLDPAELSPSSILTVSIAPVFKLTDGTESLGDIADTYTISSTGEDESCTPDCTGLGCGLDPVCGESCGSCSGSYVCTSGICISPTCTPDCEELECGLDPICNESCGSCSSNEDCISGFCIEQETCTKDCTDLECGLDPICNESCGSCSGTAECTNGVCVTPECVPNSTEVTCNGATCGNKTNNCGEIVNCGTCTSGSLCTSGSCVVLTPVNTGYVEETWPGSSGMYFGSSDLSTTSSYQGDYVLFPPSDTDGCLLIVNYIFPVGGYEKSHIFFNQETSIEVDDAYEIWKTSAECEATKLLD